MSALEAAGGEVEWIADPDRLADLAEDWDALVPPLGAPFARHAWFAAWWRAFGRGRSLAVCTLHDDAGLAGVFPLARHGRVLFALSNGETPAFRPLARDAEALARLCRAVVTAADELRVSALPAREEAHQALHLAAGAHGRLDLALPQYASPITVIDGDFEAYRGPRIRSWRELERRGRKLARTHDSELRLVAAPKDMEHELELGLALEASGWKGREGTAILGSPSTAAFYRDVARDAHRRGELRFSSLWMDGRSAAWDLALVHAGRYFLLKTAFDESRRNLAPGLVLRRAVVERLFEEGFAAHEFLGIDMPWKRLFATETREHVNYRAYRADLRGHAQHVYRARVRRMAHRVVARWRALRQDA